ncbi:MAG TPA: HNH endonuclease, partial [Chloroflexota bacterium]|nr:HNH endonuclease [Chloroflexota bacterium]
MPDSRPSADQRTQVIARARNCCEYCMSQARYAPESFSVEHIVPRAKGGQTKLNNLALACQGCNNHKYTHTEAVDPVTGEVTPLFHPRQQRWGDHFAWTEDFSQVVGLTPTGRATLETLQLNR